MELYDKVKILESAKECGVQECFIGKTAKIMAIYDDEGENGDVLIQVPSYKPYTFLCIRVRKTDIKIKKISKKESN